MEGCFYFFFYSAAAISAKSNLSPIGNGSRGTLTSWFHSYHTHFKWIIVLCHNGNMTCCPHPFVGRSFKGLRINWQRLDIMSKSPIYFFFIGFETKPSKPLRPNISAPCFCCVFLFHSMTRPLQWRFLSDLSSPTCVASLGLERISPVRIKFCGQRDL